MVRNSHRGSAFFRGFWRALVVSYAGTFLVRHRFVEE